MADNNARFILSSGNAKPRRFFGIPLRPRRLPETTSGQALIVRTRSGSYIDIEGPTPGERAWGGFDQYYVVSVTPLRCDRSYDDLLIGFESGFIVKVAVSVQVTDAAEALRQQYGGPDEVVDQVLGSIMDGAAYDFYQQHSEYTPKSAKELAIDVDPHGRPNLGSRWVDSDKAYAMRIAAQRFLQSQVSDADLSDVPVWLRVGLGKVSVEFDTNTRAHLEIIRGGRRATELTAVKHQQSEAEAESKMKIRKMWRNELKGYLSDRSLRAFEAVYDDPSADTIRRALDTVEANEREQLEQVLSVVAQQSDRGNIHSQEGFVEMASQLRELQLHDKPPSAEVLAPQLESGPPEEDPELDRDRAW